MWNPVFTQTLFHFFYILVAQTKQMPYNMLVVSSGASSFVNNKAHSFPVPLF